MNKIPELNNREYGIKWKMLDESINETLRRRRRK